MGLALKTLSSIFRECLFSSVPVHSENRRLSYELISHAKVWCGLIQYVRRGQSKQTKDMQTTLSKFILTPKNIWTSLLYLCNIYLRYETTKIQNGIISGRLFYRKNIFWPAKTRFQPIVIQPLKSILFSNKNRKINVERPDINYSDVKIKQYSKITYLCFEIEENLSREAMPLKVINKLNGKLKFLYRYNRYLSSYLKQLLSNAIIQPYCDYGC